MKNKFLKVVSSLLVVGALAVTFAACGGGEEEKPATPKKTHDPVTLLVNGTTDEYKPHNFVDGKCTMCNETTIFSQDTISKTAVTEACDQKGTVTKIDYVSHQYKHNDEPEDVIKHGWVYTPYGYDPADTTTKYEVLYMLHGAGLNEGFWFARGSYQPTDNNYSGGYATENVLDNLMKDGRAKKTICVAITGQRVTAQTPGEQVQQESGWSGGNFAKEMQEDIMPYIAEHYNTYAASGSAEDLKAARDHHGFVGLSAGASTAHSAIFGQCLEYISYIGAFSGGGNGPSLVESKNTTYKDCTINYYYATVGTLEKAGDYPGDPFGTYRTIKAGVTGMQSGSDIKNGDNCEYMLCNKTGHGYSTWITSLYNCMLVFFQK